MHSTRMVNDEFRNAPGLWFRKCGHRARICEQHSSIENLRENRIDQFFRKFSRIKLKAITSDLSRTVSRLLRRRELFRCSFCCAWHSGSGSCSCCCRATGRPNSEKLPKLSVSDAVQAATAAVSDMSQFCKRQPAACEVGGQAATVIGVRAQDGARKVYSSITDKKAAEATRTIREGQEGARSYRLDRHCR